MDTIEQPYNKMQPSPMSRTRPYHELGIVQVNGRLALSLATHVTWCLKTFLSYGPSLPRRPYCHLRHLTSALHLLQNPLGQITAPRKQLGIEIALDIARMEAAPDWPSAIMG